MRFLDSTEVRVLADSIHPRHEDGRAPGCLRRATGRRASGREPSGSNHCVARSPLPRPWSTWMVTCTLDRPRPGPDTAPFLFPRAAADQLAEHLTTYSR